MLVVSVQGVYRWKLEGPTPLTPTPNPGIQALLPSSLCGQDQFTHPPFRAVGEDTSEALGHPCGDTDTLGRTVVGGCDNQENLGSGSLLQILGEEVSCFPDLGVASHLVLGTSLHPPANWP